MPTLAVQVTAIGSDEAGTKQGILVTNPQVGENLLIYLGGDKYLRIYKVKGWMGPAQGNYFIIFDKDNQPFRVQVIASSDQFL